MEGFGRKAAVVAAMVLALAGVACGGSDDDAGGASEADGGVQADLGYEDPDAEPVESLPRNRSAALGTGNSVIKTARLHLEVERDGFQEAYRKVLAVADTTGGFVLSSEVEGDDSRTGTITIRVPATRFEAAMAELNGLGDVTRTNVTGEDVSQEFIDLEARIRNFEAQEAVILRLMERARSIPRSIRVQNELSRIQLEIEQLRGRLRYLEDQTEYGTITVGLTELGAAPKEEPSDFGRAWTLAKSTLEGIASAALIALSIILPVGVLLTLLILLFRWVRPRFGA